jgi:putative membrane protein (TIGR04086 family)
VVSAVSADEKKPDRKIRIIKTNNCMAPGVSIKNNSFFIKIKCIFNRLYNTTTLFVKFSAYYAYIYLKTDCFKYSNKLLNCGRLIIRRSFHMKSTQKERYTQSATPLFFLKCLLASYILTGLLLLILALCLYKLQIGQNVVSVAIIAIYVLATFFAGFVAGKKMQSRKFLWGLLMGVLYFVILAVMSLIVNGPADALGNSFFTTFALCCGGGMLGGMAG